MSQLPQVSPTLVGVALVGLLLAFCCRTAAAQAAANPSAGSSCAAVLSAGVYNSYVSSNTNGDFSAAQQAACADYSSYTFDQYEQDMSSASGSSSSTASSFNVGLSVMKYGSVNFGTSHSKSSSQFSEQTFNQAKTALAAYRSSNCGSSSVQSASDSSMQTLSQVIDPSVYQAYISCLNLFASGVQVTQTIGQNSVALDVKFTPAGRSESAAFTGLTISPPGTAACHVNGVGLPANASDTFQFALDPLTVYMVLCEAVLSTPADTNLTDIFITNTVSGTFHTPLFRSSPLSGPLAAAETAVTSVQATLQAVQGQVAAVGQLVTQLQQQAQGIQGTLGQQGLAAVTQRVPAVFDAQSAQSLLRYVPGDVVNFAYTGAAQQFLSLNAATVRLQVWGAQGGTGYCNTCSSANTCMSSSGTAIPGNPGGKGGYSRGVLSVMQDSYLVFVGGRGSDDNSLPSNWPYGGGGGGGGATDVRPGNASAEWNDAAGLAARLIVAGGGGGAFGGGMGGGSNRAGAGGGLVGGNQSWSSSVYGCCTTSCLATGGTATSGGLSNDGNGTFGFATCAISYPASAVDTFCDDNTHKYQWMSGRGGWNGGGGGIVDSVAGGGGGWYGGGSCVSCSAGSGGGSGYLSPSLANATTASGLNAGDGRASITILSVYA